MKFLNVFGNKRVSYRPRPLWHVSHLRDKIEEATGGEGHPDRLGLSEGKWRHRYGTARRFNALVKKARNTTQNYAKNVRFFI